MDLFTHFIVPFVILTILKINNRLSGAFGGISLDFDVIFFAIGFLAPDLFIFTHRGITHSFIFGFFTALIFIFIITRPHIKSFISNTIKRPINVEFNWTSVFIAYFGVLTHLFLDFLTIGGIPLLYPLSLTRFSANLYYYIDPITTLVALVVLIILYLKLNPKYKKIALAGFMIMLISFGGIRAYEKMDAIHSQNLSYGYIEIFAYPTSDMFTWTIVESDGGTNYRFFTYNNLQKKSSSVSEVKSLTIIKGTYSSAHKAMKHANSLSEVKRFEWNSFYTCIVAERVSSGWNITYFDFLGGHYGPSRLSVMIT